MNTRKQYYLTLFVVSLIIIMVLLSVIQSSHSTTNLAPIAEFKPKITIFIRSYRGDAHWISYLLKSITNHVKFEYSLVISIDSIDQPFFQHHSNVIMSDHVMNNGYDEQMFRKITSCENRDGFILFMDSDSVFNDDVTYANFYRENKPIYRYDSWYGDSEKAWKAKCSASFGDTCPFDFQRNMGIVMHCDDLNEIQNYFKEKHGISVKDWINEKPLSFTEFNLMGSFAWKYKHDKYFWLEAVHHPAHFITQSWSWGDFDPNILTYYDCLAIWNKSSCVLQRSNKIKFPNYY